MKRGETYFQLAGEVKNYVKNAKRNYEIRILNSVKKYPKGF